VLALLAFLFGSPSAIFRARVAAVLVAMCPRAAPADVAEAASAIVEAALDARWPVDAAARLIGAAAHETCLATRLQVRGPAVTFWQLELPASQRPAVLADTALAARVALSRAGTWEGYAGCAQGCEASRELRRYAWRARRLLDAW
jgi:hypothetical protein